MVEACGVAASKAGLSWPECDAHAGLYETSAALHLMGVEAVGDFHDVHGYIAAEAGWTDRFFREGVSGLSAIGVVGDPRHASPAAGERFIEAIAQLIARHFTIELEL